MVKLQIINLAVKLLLTNPEQTHALAHYIFFMAKFDTNYDIRDKARLIRFLLPQNSVCLFILKRTSFFFFFFEKVTHFFKEASPGVLQTNARKLLLTTKQSPSTQDESENKNKVHPFVYHISF